MTNTLETLRFDKQVAIVTGAGNGLGRSHALALAERGAKVVVNDLGSSRDGSGASSDAALQVVAEIEAMGGEAMAHGANVANMNEVEDMVRQTMERWGRVDILINNAGILRDKSFSKMSIEDFQLVVDVHLMGSVNCTKAVWDIMKQQEYGRILMTTSASGLYGNFGQSNYSAAKLALVGLMNTLALEGAKSNVLTNAIAPVATTRMTEDLIPANIQQLLQPAAVTAGALTLCGENAPNKFILCAGAGGFSQANIFETEGVFISQPEPEVLLEQWDQMTDIDNQQALEMAMKQTEKFLAKAM